MTLGLVPAVNGITVLMHLKNDAATEARLEVPRGGAIAVMTATAEAEVAGVTHEVGAGAAVAVATAAAVAAAVGTLPELEADAQVKAEVQAAAEPKATPLPSVRLASTTGARHEASAEVIVEAQSKHARVRVILAQVPATEALERKAPVEAGAAATASNTGGFLLLKVCPYRPLLHVADSAA